MAQLLSTEDAVCFVFEGFSEEFRGEKSHTEKYQSNLIFHHCSFIMLTYAVRHVATNAFPPWVAFARLRRQVTLAMSGAVQRPTRATTFSAHRTFVSEIKVTPTVTLMVVVDDAISESCKCI